MVTSVVAECLVSSRLQRDRAGATAIPRDRGKDPKGCCWTAEIELSEIAVSRSWRAVAFHLCNASALQHSPILCPLSRYLCIRCVERCDKPLMCARQFCISSSKESLYAPISGQICRKSSPYEYIKRGGGEGEGEREGVWV